MKYLQPTLVNSTGTTIIQCVCTVYNIRGIGLRGGYRIFEGGGGSNLLGLHAKGGPALVPMLKSLHPGPKGGPGAPPPPHPLLPRPTRSPRYNRWGKVNGFLLFFVLYCLLSRPSNHLHLNPIPTVNCG